MKIFYVGSFRLPYATEVFVEWALKQREIEVCRCPLANSRGDYHRGDYRLLCKKIKGWKANVVLFSKAEPAYTNDILAWCWKRGLLTVCWLWDLYWGYRQNRPKQFQADLLFTTDGGHNKEFAEHGCNHHVLRQGIHKPHHYMYPRAYTHDVAFAGGSGRGYPSVRNSLLRWLAKTYGNRFVHHTRVRELALNEALTRTKIVIADSYTESPHYWSNRIYEMIGRGSFLLHPRIIGLDEEFTDQRHYVAYKWNDYADLKSKIDYWLAHDEEREVICRQGFAHCGTHHTYTARVDVLLNHIQLALTRLLDRNP